ncbi:hypothetical protein [Carboxydocella sp. ULO1]|uniref:hypothetical protein n=1 Tax=Carboxydocella sp. ULO1 TaxID=1926599 RepID=UPI0009AF1523|nr:hypothetical protein [Carboxydocella sp. ULO1]GAW28759.1 hypothetical protein ULO1_13290 [Carboxydocella sp. ULO1]
MFDKNYQFRGKHGHYVNDMVEKYKIFKRVIDVYILAPIIGFHYDRKGEVDKSNDYTKTIMVEQLIKEQQLISFIYKCIKILLINKLSNEKSLEAVFIADEKNNENIYYSIFDSYVLGGVEILYEKLLEYIGDEDEIVDRIYEFIKEFEEFNEKPIDQEDLFKELNLLINSNKHK